MDGAWTAGQYLYSKTCHYAEDDTLPVGGVVLDVLVDGETGEVFYQVVCAHRGRIEYHSIAATDCEPGASGAHIRSDVLKSLLLAFGRDEERSRDALKHMHARIVLAGVLDQTPAR